MLKRYIVFLVVIPVVVGTPTCGKNEVFNSCGIPVDLTCSQRSPSVDRMCHARCECKEDHVKHNGVCIPTSYCQNYCGENEEFKECGDPSCEPLCENPDRGDCEGCVKNLCICKKGFVRDMDGKCKIYEKCTFGQ